MRYIPDDNLSYPVLITLDSGSAGSGFYLNYNQKGLYLVTARHVLCELENSNYFIKTKKITILSYDRNISIEDPYIAEIDLSKIPKENIIISPTQDVVVIKIAQLEPIDDKFYNIKFENSHSYKSSPEDKAATGLVFIPNSRFKKYDEVPVSNEVIIFGYPVSLGRSGEIDYKKPLLRKGIIAGKNASKKTIILDCPSYQGNSGGLVLERDPQTNRLAPIGIISSFVPFIEEFKSVHFGYKNTSIENSGYTVIIPVDFILDLIESK